MHAGRSGKMRALIQRVKEAEVLVEDRTVGRIDRGLLVFAGFAHSDTAEDAAILAEKIAALRVFPEGEREGALSVADIGGGVLAVSQFTLYADTSKGRRPSFSNAMPAEPAKKLFEQFVVELEKAVLDVESGVFQAHMEVRLVNDGPYTLCLETKEKAVNP